MEKQDTVSTVNEVAVALANEQQKAWEAKVKEQDKAIAKIADVIGLDERSKPFQIIERIRILMAYADVKASEGDGRSFIGDTIKSLMVKGNGCVIFKYADSNVCTVNNNGIHCRIGDEEERMHNFLAHVLRLGITEGMRRGKSEFDRDFEQVAKAEELKRACESYLGHIAESVGLPKDSTWASVARRVGEVQVRVKELEAAVNDARKQGFDEALDTLEKLLHTMRLVSTYGDRGLGI
jgi:acetolactate synthase small subunit